MASLAGAALDAELLARQFFTILPSGKLGESRTDASLVS
jgi:hypothetical protein